MQIRPQRYFPGGAPILQPHDDVQVRRIGRDRTVLLGAMEAAPGRRDNAPAELLRWGDWLVMAATLAHLRSRLLLPADAPEAKAAVDEAEALRRHLVGRAQMQAAAAWLTPQINWGKS
jgi:hypothetical protein